MTNVPANGLLGAISKFISMVGFPVAVAGYLLYRFDGILTNLIITMQAQTETLRLHTETIKALITTFRQAGMVP